MREEIIKLVKKTRGSSWNLHNYSVNKELGRFIEGMLLHTYYDAMKDEKNIQISNKEWLQRITPPFQRANNKWSKAMKLKFIENLLSGVNVELLFFDFKEQEDAQIIDGLQRTTAILDFIDGKIKPFGYSYSDLNGYISSFNTSILIRIYTFSTWEEVGKFYIDMNENITHSKADIQKAKDWFLSEQGIKL